MRASVLALLSSVFEIAAGADNEESCIVQPLVLVQIGVSANNSLAKRAGTHVKSIDAHNELTPETPDCSSLPRSMNGGSWPDGCPGAVYMNGDPSWKYCAGKDNAGKDKPEYAWWAACCKFDESGCRSKPDCSILPRSMNGGSFPNGCPGAVYTNGDPSWKYCAGKDNAGKDKPEYEWWAECCTFDAEGCTSKTS